jgi:hypothetical protein
LNGTIEVNRRHNPKEHAMSNRSKSLARRAGRERRAEVPVGIEPLEGRRMMSVSAPGTAFTPPFPALKPAESFAVVQPQQPRVDGADLLVL